MRVCPECGCCLEKPRSAPHHRRLFGLISAAFANWPETHEFQPESAEHLRAWLLCSAGYRQSREISVAYSEGNPGLAKLTALSIEAALKEAGAYAFIRPHPDGGSVAVYRPRSIAWSQLSQKDFAPIADAVEQVIEGVIGVKGDVLLKGHEEAA